MPVPAFIARWFPQNAYAKRVGKGLNEAYENATARPPVEVNELRAVVFSDHHRGRGDGADDFRRCRDLQRTEIVALREIGFARRDLADPIEAVRVREEHAVDVGQHRL